MSTDMKQKLILQMLKHTNNVKLKEMALTKLAKMKNLNDGQCHEIAQLIDFEAQIKLARIKGIDKRFFIKPIARNLRNAISQTESIKFDEDEADKLINKQLPANLIRLQLIQLVESAIKSYEKNTSSLSSNFNCIRYFAHLAKQLKPQLNYDENAIKIPQLTKTQVRRNQDLINKSVDCCLQAIIGLINVDSKLDANAEKHNLKFLLDNGLLLVLLTIYEDFHDHQYIVEGIAQIISLIR